MFYYITISIVISIFMLLKSKNHHTKYSILTMACYSATMLMFAIYISKDVYYYNTIDYIFSIPILIWNKMMFLPLSPSTIIRLLNLFVLLTLFWNTRFCFSICNNRLKTNSVCTRTFVTVLITEYILYDPKITEFIYLSVYPEIFSYNQFLQIQKIIHLGTMIINAGIVMISIGILYFNYRKISSIRKIKFSIGSISFFHAMIMTSFIIVFGHYPICLVKISKTAGTVRYMTAPLTTSVWFSNIFPYYLLVTFALLTLRMYQNYKMNTQLQNESFTIFKQISASDTTSKVFCHYMKNELLAIQSELEILTPQSNEEDTFNDIISRCEHLYQRLDILYKSSKTSSLVLKETDLNLLLENLIDEFSYNLRSFHVVLDFPEEHIYILADYSYLHQALHNIITNSIDAMNGLPQDRKNLSLSLTLINNWTSIEITDTGKGIAEENLDKIFTPFYSTHPVADHWGIGLSLTYKIIKAHEGDITFSSKQMKGTTVKIILPSLKNR